MTLLLLALDIKHNRWWQCLVAPRVQRCRASVRIHHAEATVYVDWLCARRTGVALDEGPRYVV